jgi:hypothetical protein
MSDADRFGILALLEQAGVEFGLRSFYRDRPGRTIPDHVDLRTLRSDEWDAEFTATWPILGADHPAHGVVEQARGEFEAKAECRAFFERAWFDREEATYIDRHDWGVPDE